MPEKPNTAGIVSFLKKILLAIVGFIVSFASVYNILKKFGIELGPVGLLILTCILLIFLICFYLRFAHSLNLTEEPFPLRFKNLGAIGMIAILLLALSGWAGWYWHQTQPPNKVIILVADFDEPDTKRYMVTENILKQLRDASHHYNDIEIKALREHIAEQQGAEIARDRGKHQKASIVLWGYYGLTKERVQVTSYFEVLGGPKNFPSSEIFPLRQRSETLITEAANLERFKIQEELGRKMSYLVLVTVGLARFEAKDFEGAINLFNQALSQESISGRMPWSAGVFFYRGYSYYLLNRNLNQAIADFDQAISLRPEFADAYNNRAITYHRKGDYDRAIADYDKAISLNPRFSIAFLNRGNIYLDKKDYLRALADYNRAIALDSEIASFFYNRGVLYYEKKDYALAITDYSKAISINPKYYNAFLNRGNAFYSKNNYDLAIDDFNRAIALDSQNANAYMSRGAAYSYRKEYNRAIADFNKAIELDPQGALIYGSRGLFYLERRDYDSAIADFNKAISLNPKSAKCYSLRAEFYNRRMNYDLAIADQNKAIALEPISSDYYFERGYIYANKNEYDLAIADYDKAIAIDPKMALAYNLRGHAFYKKRDVIRAKADWKKAEELSK